MLEIHADETPDKTALTFGSWGTRYAEIEYRVNRVAVRCLRQPGDVGPGIVVGLCVEPGVNWIAGMLGILKVGGVCVLLDASDQVARLKEIITDARISVMVVDSALENTLMWPRTRALWFDADTVEIIAAPSGRVAPSAKLATNAVAIVTYMSDASGKPRGVGLTHSAVANLLQGLRDSLDLSSEDRILSTAAPSTAEAIIECLLSISIGAELILASPREARDGDALAKLVQNHRASAMFASPDVWRSMLSAGWMGRMDMKVICTGGLPTLELAAQLASTCAGIWNVSGSADTATIATCGRSERPLESLDSGRPLANASAWVS